MSRRKVKEAVRTARPNGGRSKGAARTPAETIVAAQPNASWRSQARAMLWPESQAGAYALLGILALALVLRAFKLTTLLPILVDESIYLRWAEIIHHQGQWFISLLDGKPPLTYWLLAIQRMIWDADPLAGGRMLSVMAGLGSTIGVYAVGRLLSDERGGLVSAFLYACFPLSILYDRLAYTEGFANFFGIAVVLTSLWCFSEPGKSWKRELVPGTALALAMLTKQTLLLFAFVPALAALWQARKHERNLIARLATIYVCGGAAIVFFLLTIPDAPTLESHDAVLHHKEFFASPRELIEDPFGAAATNAVKLGGYITTYLTWPGALAAIAALAYLSWRRSMAAWVLVSASVLPWVVQVFLLNRMYPTRYPYPHFWPWFAVMGLAAADLWIHSERWLANESRRKMVAALATLLIAGPMLYQSRGMLTAPRAFLHERDVHYYMRSYGHVGWGVREAIDFLEQEAQREGGFVLLTDPVWGTPSDAMAPFLNEKHGIRVYEAWWTQLSSNSPIMPPGRAELIRSHYERTKMGEIDFSREDRVYYVTDTAYYPPEAVKIRQPGATPLRRFPKPEDGQSIDVYRFK